MLLLYYISREDIMKKTFFQKSLFLSFLSAVLLLSGCSNKGEKHNQAGMEAYQKKDYATAINSYSSAITLDNTKADYYINLAMAYVETGEYENALTQISFALELEPKNQAAYRSKGIIYIALNDYENAILAFEQALQLADGFVGTMEYDILDYRAVAESKSSNYEKAIKTYSILLEIGYKPAEHYYLRGCSYLMNQDLEKAQADFSNAIENQKSSYSMYLNIYTALSQYGAEEEGKFYLQEALKLNLGKKEDNFSKGKIYYFLGDYTNAITFLLQAQNNPEADFYLGKIYMATGDTTQAFLTFQQYLNANPNNGDIYNQLGMMRLQAGAYQEALTYFQSGLGCGDLSARKSLAYNEAVTYEYLLDFETAREKFKEYIASYPDDTQAVREYEFLKTR